jgi:spermidine synthase
MVCVELRLPTKRARMKLLVDRNDDERRIRVVEQRRDGSRLYFDSGALYTHVDADGKNLLEYITAMERVLRGAPDVLLLGTAGGALATQLSRRGVKVTAVDNWQPTFEIARRWFHLPDDVECVHADALAFLRSTPRQWSAIAVDVFQGAEIPDAFLMSDIGSLLARVARPGSLIVWNVADSPRSWPAQWIAKALRLRGLAPRVMSVMDGGIGNTLVICRNTAPPGPRTARPRDPTRAILSLPVRRDAA